MGAVQPWRRKRRRKTMIPPELKEKPHLKKYWKNRFSLFSRYDDGILLDEGTLHFLCIYKPRDLND